MSTPITETSSSIYSLPKQKELDSERAFYNEDYFKALEKVLGSLVKKENLNADEEALLLEALEALNNYYQSNTSGLNTYLKEYVQNRNSEEASPRIQQLIFNSGLEKKPSTKLEKIFHDAQIAFLGRKRFMAKAQSLRIHYERKSNQRFEELEWEEEALRILEENRFYSSSGIKKYARRREKNIQAQRKNYLNARKKTRRYQSGKDLGRGIDTLYRSSYRNHINLSSIADGKANLMISVNAIIMSVILTLSGAGFTFTGNFILQHIRFTVPILFLLICALISAVFAILSVRPKVTQNPDFNLPKKGANSSILYFGNFINVSMPSFLNYLDDLKEDQEKLYQEMGIDLYYLGIVLKQKYRLLKISYNIFMVGLILSVISFIVIFIYSNLDRFWP